MVSARPTRPNPLVDDNDAALAALRAAFESPDANIAQLAESLSAYAALAARNLDGLREIGFDVQRLDAANDLVTTLRALPPAAVRTEDEDAQLKQLRDDRNRLAALLYRRMGRVRRAARYCFADHPEIVREATSAYQRDRRTKAREDAPKPAPVPAPTT